MQLIRETRKNIGRGGYSDGNLHHNTPTGLHNLGQHIWLLYRARHETINSRIKLFRVTSTKFRHNIEKHQTCFTYNGVQHQF
jgi:hypothetical protein